MGRGLSVPETHAVDLVVRFHVRHAHFQHRGLIGDGRNPRRLRRFVRLTETQRPARLQLGNNLGQASQPLPAIGPRAAGSGELLWDGQVQVVSSQ
ncbi:MAG: hypothetical protein VYD18_00515 [Candidatus Latescibacterota bacterium]|nr:hypothetical protein [Candidatus Latescibacterota bacterium]